MQDAIASRRSLQREIYLSGLLGACRCSKCRNCHSVSSPRDSPAAVSFATTPVMTYVRSITYVGIIIFPHFLIHQFLDEFCKHKGNAKESDRRSAREGLCASCRPAPGWTSPLATTLLGNWGGAAASLCSSGRDAAQKHQESAHVAIFKMRHPPFAFLRFVLALRRMPCLRLVPLSLFCLLSLW